MYWIWKRGGEKLSAAATKESKERNYDYIRCIIMVIIIIVSTITKGFLV